MAVWHGSDFLCMPVHTHTYIHTNTHTHIHEAALSLSLCVWAPVPGAHKLF